MRLFDRFKKRAREESFLRCSVCNRETDIPLPNAVAGQPLCSECRHLERLQKSNAVIADIDRREDGPERILTVLFFDETIGHFCVQQSSGAYSGLGLRYQILSHDISVPEASAYVDDDGYSSWIPNRWFSEAFEMDMYGQKYLETIKLPQSLHSMSFDIVLKKAGCSLPDGGLLECFHLHKKRYGEIKVSWSVGFGYAMGAHNPGASGDDIVPSEFFFNHDLHGFAAYLSDTYKGVITYDEVYYNAEVKALFVGTAGRQQMSAGTARL